MIKTEKLLLDDKQWVDKLIAKENRIGCEYTFASNFIWQDVLNIEYGKFCECYISHSHINDMEVFNYPVGSQENILKAIKEIINCYDNVIIRGLTKQQTFFLNEKMPNTFKFSSNRNESDYIYSSESLASLKGKKLQSKRNHIHRFCDNDNWQYENIDESNVNECIELNRLWVESKENALDVDVRRELGAANIALACLKQLGLVGGLIRLEGKVVAYSIGEPIGEDCFVVHFEKADAKINGAYAVINNEFVKHNCTQYKYINREEDAGDEGLRKAKLSYRPLFLLEKFNARLI